MNLSFIYIHTYIYRVYELLDLNTFGIVLYILIILLNLVLIIKSI